MKNFVYLPSHLCYWHLCFIYFDVNACFTKLSGLYIVWLLLWPVIYLSLRCEVLIVVEWLMLFLWLWCHVDSLIDTGIYFPFFLSGILLQRTVASYTFIISQLIVSWTLFVNMFHGNMWYVKSCKCRVQCL